MKNLECLQRAVDYMEEHLDRPMNMTEIAEVSYLSERTLAELFCSMTGMPVMDYVRKRRLSLAAEDILHTEEKILHISYKYGYESQEGFSRAFRRFHGISPQQLRKTGGDYTAVECLRFVNNNVVGGNESKGYRVLENGPVYHTLEMDNVVDWFRNILGWIANVDARDDNGAGTFGCAMPIADPVASERMNSFLGFSLIYGEPLKRIIGYLTVDCVDNLRETILQNGWEKVTEIRQTPWGARECSVTTPDGGILVFSSYEAI